ncbi:hypothetical protein MHBO_002360, partial [Bonamia ostreae]
TNIQFIEKDKHGYISCRQSFKKIKNPFVDSDNETVDEFYYLINIKCSNGQIINTENDRVLKPISSLNCFDSSCNGRNRDLLIKDKFGNIFYEHFWEQETFFITCKDENKLLKNPFDELLRLNFRNITVTCQNGNFVNFDSKIMRKIEELECIPRFPLFSILNDNYCNANKLPAPMMISEDYLENNLEVIAFCFNSKVKSYRHRIKCKEGVWEYKNVTITVKLAELLCNHEMFEFRNRRDKRFVGCFYFG